MYGQAFSIPADSTNMRVPTFSARLIGAVSQKKRKRSLSMHFDGGTQGHTNPKSTDLNMLALHDAT
jgi:hypothetical protein